MWHNPPHITEQEKLLCRRLHKVAAQCGFVAIGATQAEPIAPWRQDQMQQWLDKGHAAEMEYLHRQFPLRNNLNNVLPEVQTIFSFAIPYATKSPFSAEGFTLARYALGRDYHDVVKERVRQFVTQLQLPSHQQGRVCCDTAPVDERYWAWRCGVGQWLDNAQIAVPGYGTFIFLGEWLCPLSLSALNAHLDAISFDEMAENCKNSPFHRTDESVAKREEDAAAQTMPEMACLSCGRCSRACPGGALTKDGLDARRCLSYLTIEHRGELSEEIAQTLGNRIYGCDTCAEVCPVNHIPLLSANSRLKNIPSDFLPKAALTAMQPSNWQRLTQEEYHTLFKGSAVKRAKYEGLMRNIRAVSSLREEKDTPHPSPEI